MNKYIIELRGVEFHNKGAELMLYAILDQIRDKIPSAEFVMEKTTSAPIAKQRAVGIKTKLNFRKFKLNTAFFGKFIPKALRLKLGFVLENEINVVLDGSGFAFGDFWGADKAGVRLANHIVKWKSEGKKVIMLSQAFGAFEKPDLRLKMKTIIDNADLIFARDRYSFDFLKDIKPSTNNIHLRPDFTNLIQGAIPEVFDKIKHEVGIIPNNKLLESKTFASRDIYIRFLSDLVITIESLGKKPYFLVHEGVKDLNLVQDANRNLPLPIPILQVEDPLHVKGIIGASTAIITSRFHGLVSALSQAIPCLCIGWSHKYLALMEDYDYAEGLLQNTDLNAEQMKIKLKFLVNPDTAKEITSKLGIASKAQKALSADMWDMVVKAIKA